MNRPSAYAPSILLLGAVLVACTGGNAAGPATMTEPMQSESASGTAPSNPAPVSANPSSSTSAPSAPAEASDALLAIGLTDVRSGETFTLADLIEAGQPVLLQPMAVWCSSCRAQQHEVVQAHEAGQFTSVSLDVDLSESPEDLAAYADREGFDWHFAMADADLYRALQDRFGVAVTNPPLTPLVVIGADGTVRPLEFGRGIRGAEELLAELGAG